MEKCSLLFVLSLSLLAGGSWASPAATRDRSHPRIVNGTDITIERVPFQVSLQFYNSHSCGGAILDEYTILTAAHCLDFLGQFHPISTLSVRVGSSFLHRDGQMLNLSRMVIHENYNADNYDYDIAVLKLDRALEFGWAVRPVQVAQSRDALKDYEFVQVSGWGRTETGGALAEVLQKIEMPVLEQNECIKIFGRINPITDRMFCAGFLSGEGDSCNGDSGGPLVNNRNILYGLVSWGPAQCAIEGYTGVYTNVAYFHDWIEQHMGQESDDVSGGESSEEEAASEEIVELTPVETLN